MSNEKDSKKRKMVYIPKVHESSGLAGWLETFHLAQLRNL